MQRAADAPRAVEETKGGHVKVFALVTFNEDEALALAKYLEITEPLLKREGARIIERFSLEDDVVGHRPAKSVIIVEYLSRASRASASSNDRTAAFEAP